MSDEITTAAGEGEYVVQPGDSLGSIAAAHGHFWQTLWDLPENAALRELRKHPHILLPGDRVTIPPLRIAKHNCATGAVHRFRRKGVPTKIRFTLRDSEGNALTGKKYELVVDGVTYDGATDEEGRIERFVDPLARSGDLTIWLDDPAYPEKITRKLRIGELAPAETVEGARARLEGLGYLCGDESSFRQSLAAFQRTHDLTASAELDAATGAALREAYGS